jgi:Holliday junction resolvasome RuvABC endonuclease subunit
MTIYSRLLAIDPSLTCSGWALFDSEKGELLSVGKVKAPPPSTGSLAERLAILQQKVTMLFAELDFGRELVLVCESATTMKDPRAVFVVEQVRGIFEVLARARGACIPGRVHPRSVQYEVIGLRGPQEQRDIVKRSARMVAVTIYSAAFRDFGFNLDDDKLKSHQDIVDAVLIGHLAVARLRSWSLTNLPLEHFFSENETIQTLRRAQ